MAVFDKPPSAVFDPLLGKVASDAGVDPARLASVIGGNTIGGLITVPADILLTKLGAKTALLLGGGAGLAYSLSPTGPLRGRGRVQDDAIVISSRVLTGVLDPDPNDLRELQQDWGRFWNAILTGNWEDLLWAFVRRPATILGQRDRQRKQTGDQTKETPGLQGSVRWG